MLDPRRNQRISQRECRVCLRARSGNSISKNLANSRTKPFRCLIVALFLLLLRGINTIGAVISLIGILPRSAHANFRNHFFFWIVVLDSPSFIRFSTYSAAIFSKVCSVLAICCALTSAACARGSIPSESWRLASMHFSRARESVTIG